MAARTVSANLGRPWPADVEERIAGQASLRSWRRAGWLGKAQTERLLADLKTPWRHARGGKLLLYIVFSLIGVGALIGLDFVSGMSIHWIALLVHAAIFLGGTELVIRKFLLHRVGLELVLLLAGLGFFAAAVAISTTTIERGEGQIAGLATCVLCAALSFGCFLRYGHVLLGLVAIALGGIAAVILPATLGIGPELSPKLGELLALATMATIWFVLERKHARSTGVAAGELDWLCAGALLATYLAANCELWSLTFGSGQSASLHRATKVLLYLLTWILPAVGMRHGIRRRRKKLIWAAGVAALATFATNKSFLGLERYPWDAMILGVVLGGVSLWLRWWLDRGPAAMRNGYTANRGAGSDAAVLDAMVATALALHAGHAAQASTARATSDKPFSGGRSGGGGAQGSF